MTGVAKLVDDSDFFQVVAGGSEDGDIAGKGCGIAAYIDESFWIHPDQGVKEYLVTAFSWWINNDNICMGPVAPFLVNGRNNFLRFSGKEFDVMDIVKFRIFTGIQDCLRNDLHTVYLFCFLSKKQGDGSDAAIHIPDGFLAVQICIFQCFFIKYLSLHRVYLIEGQR